MQMHYIEVYFGQQSEFGNNDSSTYAVFLTAYHRILSGAIILNGQQSLVLKILQNAHSHQQLL